MIRRKRAIATVAARLVHSFIGRMGRGFFWYLALAISLAAIVDITTTRFISGMQDSTFDFLMRHRFHYAPPDPGIVIVDIDDASLKEMSATYGRWPWPRRVIGDLVERLESLHPQAIVFDIAFTEPDRLNAASDRQFVQAIARHANIFLPMILLDEHAADSPSILLPFFKDEIPADRLGLNNVFPDKDSVIRRFSPAVKRNGLEIPSIPLRVARFEGFSPPAAESLLINWRGPPYSFNSVSFSYLQSASDGAAWSRLRGDFEGKTVIIGSTAASLFDVKASPMASVHPGVEILATVIDNARNGDALREQPPSLYAAIAVAFVLLLALAFYAQRNTIVSDSLFVALQLSFIVLSYVLLNTGNVYLDMTAPFTFGVAYFTLARTYAHQWERFHADRTAHLETLKDGQRYRFTAMAVAVPYPDAQSRRAQRQQLESLVRSSAAGASRVGNLFDSSRVLGALFDDITVIYWMVPESEVESHAAVLQDADRIRAGLHELNRGRNLRAEIRSCVRTGTLTWHGSESARAQGRQVILSALSALAQV